ncbi:WD40 repeat-like protein [Aureobasidium subglaciale]|nr:WD40 repeat-like protein [Aureobasidium subglaciale]
MPGMNRAQFLERFVYAVEKDLDINGTTALWVTSDQEPAHRFWGNEDYKIEVPHGDDTQYGTTLSALSPDKKFIATSSGGIISIFNIDTKECCMTFKGLVKSASRIDFIPVLTKAEGYTLMIATANQPRDDSDLHSLELARYSRKVQQPQLLDVDELLEKSLESIITSTHDLLGSSAIPQLLETIRADYRNALNKLQSTLESKCIPRITDDLGSYFASPFSSDGKLLLFRIDNRKSNEENSNHISVKSTEGLVVCDLANDVQKHVLRHHTDTISWARFSPDDQNIATASFDGTFRIYDTTTGECKHVIGPMGGQGSRGQWSPNSKHVLFTGSKKETLEDQAVKQTMFVTVYSAETGQEVADLTQDDTYKRVLSVAWSLRDEIATNCEAKVLLWIPFNDTIKTSFVLEIEDRMMRAFARSIRVKWVEEGRVLLLKSSDGTIEMWDQDENIEWRLEKLAGIGMIRAAYGEHWLERSRVLISLNVDGYLRFYNFDKTSLSQL